MSSGILLRPLFVCRNVIIVTILSLTCAGNRVKCNAVLRNCNKVCGCGTGTAPAGARTHQARSRHARSRRTARARAEGTRTRARTHAHQAGRTQRRQVQQAGSGRCSRQHAHARPCRHAPAAQAAGRQYAHGGRQRDRRRQKGLLIRPAQATPGGRRNRHRGGGRRRHRACDTRAAKKVLPSCTRER